MSKTGFKYNIGDVVFYIKDVPCAGIITDRRAADYDEDYVIEKYYTLNNDINLYENDLYKTKQDAMLEQVKQSKHNFADDFDSVIKKIQARNKTIYNFLFNDYDSETIVITIPSMSSSGFKAFFTILMVFESCATPSIQAGIPPYRWCSRPGDMCTL